jgi:hypothetical protein
MAIERGTSPSSHSLASLDTSQSTPGPVLLSADEAKERLREIVEGFFFRRLRTDDGKRVARLLVKSPPGLGKTTEAIECAIPHQAEQEGKDGRGLVIGDVNEAGVPAQTSIFRPAPPARSGAEGGDRVGLPGEGRADHCANPPRAGERGRGRECALPEVARGSPAGAQRATDLHQSL